MLTIGCIRWFQTGPEPISGNNVVKSINIANCGVKRIKRDNKNPNLLNFEYLPSVYFSVIQDVNKPLLEQELIILNLIITKK